MAESDPTIVESHCPSLPDLQAFAAGRLSSESTDSIAAHVEQCAFCQAKLETLDGAEASIDGWVRPESEIEFVDESECEEAVAAVARGGAPPPSAAPSSPGGSAPRRLGDFELLERLGEGGMGTVYKARHATLGTTYAVKLLHHRRQADRATIERFQREMVALGRLDHPNIVRAVDAGEEDGIHYLVMEFVDGVDLARVLRQRGALSISNAAEAARQAALGLAYVHQQGRVHRDVKPSNLMVGTDGTVKLLDLGLARVEEYALDEAPGATDDVLELGSTIELTRTHQVMGTLEYMSPEQAASSKSVDDKSDLYSLGCTLYKLLTGHSPFASEKSMTAMSQVLAHVEKPAPPVRNFRPEVPAELAALLERLLAKRREHRPASAADVAAALAPFAAGANLKKLSHETPAAADASSSAGSSKTVVLPSSSNHVRPRKRVPWGAVVLASTAVLLLVGCPVGLVIYALTQIDREVFVERGPVMVTPAPPIVHEYSNGDAASSNSTVASAESDANDALTAGEAGPVVNLIPLLDPERDIRGNDWALVNGALVSRADVPSMLHFPYRPPAHYRWEATVQRLENAESLQIGLVAGGQPLVIIVDGHPAEGPYTGMYRLNGRGINAHQTSVYTGQVLRPGQPVRLAAWVKHDGGRAHVRLDADGQTLFSWLGSISSTGSDGNFPPNDPGALFLGNWTASLRVSDIRLIPLAGDGEVIEFTDAAADPQRAAIERAVWKRGAVTVRTSDGRRATVERLWDIEDGMQIVEVDFARNEWIKDADIPYFAGIETLTALDLSGTAVTAAGFDTLGPLPNLQRLSLSQSFGPGALPRIVEGYPNLEVLEAAGNRIVDEDLASLTALTELQSLDLSRTSVTSDGIASLPALPALKSINLAGTAVDDASSLTAERFPDLAWINLLGTNITAEAAAQLDRRDGTAVQNERSDTPSAPEAPVAGGGAVEVVPLIDIERDGDDWETDWTREEGGVLHTHPKSRVFLPVRLPMEFDLELSALAAEPVDATIVGLALPDGTHFAIGFDHRYGKNSEKPPVMILHGVDGQQQGKSTVQTQIETFPSGSDPVSLIVQVRGEGEQIQIRVIHNGEEALAWDGDRTRLQLNDPWWLGPDPTRPWISQWGGVLEIRSIVVKPASGSVELLNSPRDPVLVTDGMSDSGGADAEFTAVTGYGPIDLIRLVDVERDSGEWGAPWQKQNGVLQVPRRSRIGLPIALPMEFDIEMTATRRAQGNAPVFVLPLPDGTLFTVGFDHRPEQGSYTILHGIDGTVELSSPAMTQIETFPQDVAAPVDVRISVRGTGETIDLRVAQDGVETLHWEGDRSRFDMPPDHWWSGTDLTRPWMALFDGAFTIHKLRITPHNGRIAFPDFGPSHGTHDRAVAEWVLAHGGIVKLLFSADGREQEFTAVNALPERPFWVRSINQLAGNELPREWLQQVATLSHLKWLVLSDTSFDNADLGPLAELKTLTHAGLWSSTLNDQGLHPFAEIQGLEQLFVGKTSITAAAFEPFREHPTLTNIGIPEVGDVDAICEIAATIPNLNHLGLGASPLSGDGLRALAGTESLTRLYINSCPNLATEDAASLLGLPNLETLHVHGNGWGPAAAEPIGRLTSLRNLSLDENPLGDEGIAHLAGLRQLRELRAWDVGMTDASVEAIVGMRTLQILSIGGNPGITDASIPLLSRMDSLRELQVGASGITLAGIQKLQAALPNCVVYAHTSSNSDELDLRGQIVSDATLPRIIAGQQPKTLILEGPGITDASVPYLAALPGVTRLKLHGVSITNEGLSPFAAAHSINWIEFWNMPQITEAALPHIARIPDLKAVAFKSTGVYGPGLEHLHGLGLEWFYLGNTQFDGEMLRQYVIPFQELKGLDLAGSRIADEDVEDIAGMTVTDYLHLGFNPNITGPGLRFIRDLPPLRNLNLDFSGVDDEGLTHLAGTTELQNLHVRNTSISDESIETLGTLTGLQRLDVSRTWLTDEGVARLRELLPQTTVIADELIVAAGYPPPDAEFVAADAWKPSFSPEGAQLAYGLPQGKGIAIADLESGETRMLVDRGKDAAWSPRGDWIAIVHESSHNAHDETVWLYRPDATESRELVTGLYPFWIDDGRTLVYYSRELPGLMSIDIDDSEAQPVEFQPRIPSFYCTATQDGAYLAYGHSGRVEVLERATGEIVFQHQFEQDTGTGLPAFSWDGEFLAYSTFGTAAQGIWLLDWRSGETVRLNQAACQCPAWSLDGRQLAFDFRFNGPGREWLEVWRMDVTNRLPGRQPTADQGPPRTSLFVVDEDGSGWNKLADIDEFGTLGSPAVSPDGRLIAFDGWRSQDGEKNVDARLLIADSDGTNVRDLGDGAMPTWSADGRLIAFCRYGSNQGVWICGPDGSGLELIDGAGWGAEGAPDGGRIFYYRGLDLLLYNVESGRKQMIRLPHEDNYIKIYWNGAWSPDGRRLALVLGRNDGLFDVITLDLAEPQESFRVHHTGPGVAQNLAWHPDGMRLLVPLENRDRGLLQIYQIDPVGASPLQLFPGQDPDRNNSGIGWFPDGSRLVVCSRTRE